jgi:hypothetical protein
MLRNMKTFFCVLVVAVCALFGSAKLEAQTRADSAAILLHTAEQLRLRGEAGAARALLDHIERQYAGTAAAAGTERIRLAMRRMSDPEGPGRTELILWGTGYGAWLGIAVPLMLDANSPEAYGVGFLAGAPLGFLAARSLAERNQPTIGQTRSITFGGSWGTYQGFGWAEALDIGDRRVSNFCPPEFQEDCYYEETDTPTRVAIGVLGGLAGIGTGVVLSRKPITGGTAAATGSGALWGTWFGFALSMIADLEDDALLSSTLLAGNAALLGTAVAAPRWGVTEGRVRLVNVGGLIGGLAGVGALLIAQPDDERVAISIPMIGSAIGLAVGIATTRDRVIDSPGDGGQGALLNVDRGRWALDLPTAAVTMARTDAGLRPAAYVPLLRARF